MAGWIFWVRVVDAELDEFDDVVRAFLNLLTQFGSYSFTDGVGE
jgi:hypothetical protein